MTDECCICLELINIENDKVIHIINDTDNTDRCNCNINLHSECFFLWYKKNLTCPICRININQDNLFFNNIEDFDILKNIKQKLSLPSEEIINNILDNIDINQDINQDNHHRNRGGNYNYPNNIENRTRTRNRNRINRRRAILMEDNNELQNNRNNRNNRTSLWSIIRRIFN